MTQEITTKAKTPLQAFRETMEGDEMRAQIKMALPPHIPVEKFTRVVTTAVSNDPKLLEANRMSLYNASMKAAADGLVPDGKEAALVTFNKNVGTKDAPRWESQVQYMPMVSGILKKVRNSGELASISAFIVHEGEKFELWVDNTGEHFRHDPIVFGKKGRPIGVYAQAQTKDGGMYFEMMSEEQVMAVKSVSKTKTVWEGPFAHEKWKVACIRRLSKRLPMSTDLEHTIQQVDEEIDFDDKPEMPATPKPEPATNMSSRLKAAVNVTAAAAPKPPVVEKYSEAPGIKSPTPVAKQEPNEAPLTEAEEQSLPI